MLESFIHDNRKKKILEKALSWFKQYGLISQTRIAPVSIAAIIAEGCGRESNKELTLFTNNSMGSAFELDFLLLRSYDLKFIPDADYHILN